MPFIEFNYNEANNITLIKRKIAEENKQYSFEYILELLDCFIEFLYALGYSQEAIKQSLQEANSAMQNEMEVL